MARPARLLHPAHRRPAAAGGQPARHDRPVRRLPCGRRQGRAVLDPNEREWAALCERFLERPELADDSRFATGSARVANRAELDVLVQERFHRDRATEIMRILDGIGIACAGVNSVAEILDHPVLAGRDRWREVAVPGGATLALVPPADLGHTAADIAALRADSVV